MDVTGSLQLIITASLEPRTPRTYVWPAAVEGMMVIEVGPKVKVIGPVNVRSTHWPAPSTFPLFVSPVFWSPYTGTILPAEHVFAEVVVVEAVVEVVATVELEEVADVVAAVVVCAISGTRTSPPMPLQ